jgi:hypothetical protein
MANSTVQLTVFGREDCHLCEEMLAELREMQQTVQFGIEFVDVDRDGELEKRYGLLVPVLTAGEQEICHYHLDRRALLEYLGATAER